MQRLLLLLALAVSPSLTAADDPPAAKFGSLAAGVVAPDFSAIGADGKEIKLSDFKGRVVVVAFWAPNRGPPAQLQSAFAAYEAQGVSVLAIGSAATREEFDGWVAKSKGAVTYTLAWDPAGKADAGRISQKHFGVAAYPATGVIDRQGKVVGGFIGFGANAAMTLRGYLHAAGIVIPAAELPKPPAPPEQDETALKPGTVAPDFTAFDLADAPVKLSDFAGKIVVLDFWATWCGPCIRSMPHTQQVAAATKAHGVVVLASCTSDTRGNFEAWLRDNQSKFPDLIFANDPNGRDGAPDKYAERASLKLYGVRGIPTQFVIGRDGKIAAVLVGYGEGDHRLEDELAKLGVKP